MKVTVKKNWEVLAKRNVQLKQKRTKNRQRQSLSFAQREFYNGQRQQSKYKERKRLYMYCYRIIQKIVKKNNLNQLKFNEKLIHLSEGLKCTVKIELYVVCQCCKMNKITATFEKKINIIKLDFSKVDNSGFNVFQKIKNLTSPFVLRNARCSCCSSKYIINVIYKSLEKFLIFNLYSNIDSKCPEAVFFLSTNFNEDCILSFAGENWIIKYLIENVMGKCSILKKTKYGKWKRLDGIDECDNCYTSVEYFRPNENFGYYPFVIYVRASKFQVENIPFVH